MKKLITSALPYVNNVPHLGNIIGCVLSADVYARFCRARGYETLYICGTDEYGTATENKAREEGLTPREICDKYHAIHAEIYQEFNISFDAFGRTSTQEQTDIAQSIFKDLDANGLISEHTDERTFCEHDDMFLADRYVEGTCPHCGYEDARGDQCDNCRKLLEPEKLVNPRCKICGNPPSKRSTSHLHLELNQLQERLGDWVAESSKKGKWSHNAVQTTNGWLERGLEARPITRDLKWGIPVPKPGYENKVFYVWYDAPIGYISITARAFPDTWKDWWHDPEHTALYQFMAKDNIPFHTVIFPASLLGSGKPWTLLHHINSTEYLNYEDTKFSKSRNVGVFGTDVRETGIPTDLWRFYLLMVRPEKNDSAFSWSEFFERVNSDFINNLGNLVNRALTYLHKNFDGKIRDFAYNADQSAFRDAVIGDLNEITDALEEVRMRDALRSLLALGNRANKFFQDSAPWAQIKEDADLAHATVSLQTYVVRAVAVALEPYMPDTSKRIFEMLGLEGQCWKDALSFTGLDGHTINKPSILYKNLDMKLAEKYRKKFSGDAPNFGDFDLRVGQIVKVEDHPDSEHLYVMQVNVGDPSPRTIVAGLKKVYSPADLLERKVVVLANLAEAEIRGVASQGMVLVCEKRNKMELLDATDFAIGSRATSDGEKVSEAIIDINTFKGAPLRVSEGKVSFDEVPVLMEGQPLGTRKLLSGKIK